MNEWQSIRTAPTDYDAFREGPRRHLVFGPSPYPESPNIIAVAWRDDNERKIWWTGEHGNSAVVYATHWQPLPAPPSFEAGATSHPRESQGMD